MSKYDKLYAAYVGGVVLISLLLLVTGATAQTNHDQGHAEFHDVYRTWMMPHSPTTPCCDAKKTINGETTGDCYPTLAELRPSALAALKGQPVWWALRDNGEWIEVPEDRYIRELNPDPTGSRAHICEVDGSVFCFRPPVGGT